MTGQVTEETPRNKSITHPELAYSATKNKPAHYEQQYKEFEKRAENGEVGPGSLDQYCYIDE